MSGSQAAMQSPCSCSNRLGQAPRAGYRSVGIVAGIGSTTSKNTLVGRQLLAGSPLQHQQQQQQHASRRRPAVAPTRAMFKGGLGALFKGDPAEKARKRFQDKVDAVNALEPAMQALSDEQLRGKTDEFKKRVAGGEELDALLPEAFAVRALC